MAGERDQLARSIGAEICSYLDYLIHACGYHITLHKIERAALENWPQLLSYNYHTCAVCMEMKSSMHAWQHCINRQEGVKDRTKQGPFRGTCYAGVSEWVFPLSDINGAVQGFLCVSGYTMDRANSRVRATAAAKKYGLPSEKLAAAVDTLEARMPTEDVIVKQIGPIQSMFRTLFWLNEEQPIQGRPVTTREKLYSDILRYINGNARSPSISLRSVCERFSLSYAYASRLFSEFNDMPFSAYVRSIRIEAVKCYLEHTMLSIVSTAEMCGFSDSNYMATVFRASVGMSPSEYRRRYNPAFAGAGSAEPGERRAAVLRLPMLQKAP